MNIQVVISMSNSIHVQSSRKKAEVEITTWDLSVTAKNRSDFIEKRIKQKTAWGSACF